MCAAPPSAGYGYGYGRLVRPGGALAAIINFVLEGRVLKKIIYIIRNLIKKKQAIFLSACLPNADYRLVRERSFYALR